MGDDRHLTPRAPTAGHVDGNIGVRSCIVGVMEELCGRPSGVSTTDAEDSAALFERERGPMVRLAVLMVSSVEVAEDVVQEAFAVVDARWATLGNPGGYLRASVVNGCRMALRRRNLERRVGEQQVAVEVDELPVPLIELRDALDRLGERQRAAIVLRYFVDVPDTEIAELLGCRPATVRSLVRRALRVLREELA